MRKIEKPSDEFFKFLQLVNKLRGVNLPAIAGLDRVSGKEDLYKIIQKHPELYKYVFNKMPGDLISLTEIRIGIWEKYTSFQQDREMLLRIVEELSEKTFPFNKDGISIENIYVPMFTTLDHNGHLKYERAAFKRFDNLDVTRFRVCPVCSDIFWLSRTDKKACSKCANIAAQRAFQERNREEIKLQRRNNYAYRKSLKLKGDSK